MSSLQRAAIETALSKKGFVREERDHSYFWFLDEHGQRTAINTKTSHGSGYREIGDPLLGQMAEQIGLKKREFVEFVRCNLSLEKYRAKLKKDGFLLSTSGPASPPPPAPKRPI